MAVPILLPDLGMPQARLSLWFAEPGDEVYAGDRLVEILTGPATFDVSAPVSGRLLERLAVVDQAVVPGDVLGLIEPSEPD